MCTLKNSLTYCNISNYKTQVINVHIWQATLINVSLDILPPQ